MAENTGGVKGLSLSSGKDCGWDPLSLGRGGYRWEPGGLVSLMVEEENSHEKKIYKISKVPWRMKREVRMKK